jgi:hypothetical protein
MLDYHEYQKKVYEAFLMQRNKDNQFNFSVRQQASKGTEKNYFIGTEYGKYFSTTLWNIKVGYPGSAGNLINVVFSYTQNDEKLGYHIEFTQTNSPSDNQNKWALELIKSLEILIKDSLGLKKKSKKTQKICNYQSISRKESYYDCQELVQDVFNDLEVIMPIVNRNIDRIKTMFPEFVAHQITNTEFENQQVRLKERLEKLSNNIDVTDQMISPLKKEMVYTSLTRNSLNTILYGPPGTGKTYHTINKAIGIINPAFNLGQNRAEVKKEYTRLVENGQIVFTTFHQSMGYEDFIEGIKPSTLKEKEEDEISENIQEDSKPIQYEIQDGIFKRLCQRAKGGALIELDFDSLWKKFYQHIISLEEEVIFRSISSEIRFVKADSTEEVLNVRFKRSTDDPNIEGRRLFHSRKNGIKRIFDERLDVTDPTINSRQEIEKILSAGRSTIYNAVYKSFFEFNNLGEKFRSKKTTGEFVLIIDEINRGNVSQIFGELITLIEEDKRLGQEEELQVILPYSKKPFGVPSNLHIIGTMNTADRSVEALDTALRRRFTFEEMPPNYKLQELNREIGGINLLSLLKTINGRIEILLDKDHLIGHSYFVKIQNIQELKTTFQHKIIPLLQEYFFGDYGKIGLILGERFFENGVNGQIARFKNFFDYSDDGFSDRKVFRLKNLSQVENDDFEEIIKELLR